jgi:hypothetical protein
LRILVVISVWCACPGVFVGGALWGDGIEENNEGIGAGGEVGRKRGLWDCMRWGRRLVGYGRRVGGAIVLMIVGAR